MKNACLSIILLPTWSYQLKWDLLRYILMMIKEIFVTCTTSDGFSFALLRIKAQKTVIFPFILPSHYL